MDERRVVLYVPQEPLRQGDAAPPVQFREGDRVFHRQRLCHGTVEHVADLKVKVRYDGAAKPEYLQYARNFAASDAPRQSEDRVLRESEHAKAYHAKRTRTIDAAAKRVRCARAKVEATEQALARAQEEEKAARLKLNELL